MVVLCLARADHHKLRTHLLRQQGEAAAFLYVRARQQDGRMVLDLLGMDLMAEQDIVGESAFGLELTDGARNRVFGSARQLNATIVEAHSHPFTKQGVSFSVFDMEGLKEFVPHVWWRLGRGPYVALVFGQTDFDGLAWIDSPHQARSFGGTVLKGGRLLKPTGLTIRRLGAT